MRLDLVTPPVEEPVSLDEAKKHLREDLAGDDGLDALIMALVTAARRHCEKETRRAFVTQTWDLSIDRFPYRAWGHFIGVGLLDPSAYPTGRGPLERLMLPGTAAIRIPRPRLQSIDSITYLDVAGVAQVLDPSAYRVVPGTPGLVEPAYGTTWPATRPVVGAVTIRFTAGYGAAADVPAAIKAAIKLLVGSWYENPSAVITGTIATELPMGVQALLATEDWGSYP